MKTAQTEVIALHRVTIGRPQGVLRIVRAYCRCGSWSIRGPQHRAQRRAAAHERTGR